MSTRTKCQRNGGSGPSLDRYEQRHGVTKRQISSDCAIRQMFEARVAAQNGEPQSATWCALAMATYHDYRGTLETLQINGWSRRKAA
jgi:hypothetical protein